MKVVTAEQIRELDRRAMQEFGIPGVVLMENAGHAVVEVMQREYGSLFRKTVVVACGTGNNGGDGFVIARYLGLEGAYVWLFVIGDEARISGDAKIHYDIMKHCNCCVDEQSEDAFGLYMEQNATEIDFVVDALLGTGVKNAPREPISYAIQSINRRFDGAEYPVISVDIPSGVEADTGATPGEAVRATHTVTFAYPKQGMYLPPGSDRVGKLHIAYLGVSWDLLPQRKSQIETVEDGGFGCFDGVYPLRFLKRQSEANKGDFGHVAVIAGSRNMAGAPSLVAHGAQRAGAGLVTVLTADSAQPILAAKLSEQMTLPLPEVDGAIAEAAFEKIAQFAEKATVLCVGPGMGQHPQTVALIHRIITEIKKPLVLDADGLNALAQNPDIIEKREDNLRCTLILTPHPGEAGRLLGTSADEVQSNRLESLRELARKYRAIVVLKGRYTLTGDASGKVYINTSGNPGMATGGSGDTLTGILGGLLSQALAPDKKSDNAKETPPTFSPLAVTALAVMLHGMAGDLAAEQRGQVGLIAGDIIEALPLAIRRLEEVR